MHPVVRDARPDEAAELTRLVLVSKAHWGYSAGFMAACVDELTVTPERCSSGEVRVVQDADGIAGVAALAGRPPQGGLDLLYVDPTRMGRGVGRLLVDDTVKRARTLGMTWLLVDADPHAEAFYERLGAVRVGTTPSGSIPGRELPRLRLALTSP